MAPFRFAPATAAFFLLLAALFSPLPPGASGKRLRDRIYRPLPRADRFCFRRTNGTAQFGCTSALGGDVGVVHLVEGRDDVEWIAERGPHPPYVAAFVPRYVQILRGRLDP